MMIFHCEYFNFKANSHSHSSLSVSAKTLKVASFTAAASKCCKTGSQNAKVCLYEPVNAFGGRQGSNIRNPLGGEKP